MNPLESAVIPKRRAGDGWVTSRRDTAGPSSRRGIVWFGKAVFAVAALAVTSAFAAWIFDFDPPTASKTASPTSAAEAPATFSFDDRFGSGPVRNSGSINYPSRPILRSLRPTSPPSSGTSKASWPANCVKGRRINPSGPRHLPRGAIPLPRSRPVEANLQARNDPPPVQADNRTLLQKLADLMPPRSSRWRR